MNKKILIVRRERENMSRKGENIFLRKDGRWEARYIKERKMDGRYRYGYVYGKNYLEVKNKRNEILLNLEQVKKKHESCKYIEPRTYYNRYKTIVERAEIGNYGFHALRHTFATRCIEIGMDPKTLSEILGHSDVKVTLSLYVHPSNKMKDRYMERLNPTTM